MNFWSMQLVNCNMPVVENVQHCIWEWDYTRLVVKGFCPIYKKKGDPANADNYRGIAILSCYGKLFTCVLINRLFNYLESLGLLSEEQAGFRKGYDTVDRIF